jgi:putative membrane protein
MKTTWSAVQRFLIFWGLHILVLWVVDALLDSLAFDGPQSLLVGGLVFGLVNTFLKPLLLVLTLPIAVITLGLFLPVLNTGLLYLVAWLVPGFTVGTFWQTLGAALLVSLVTFALNVVLRGQVQVRVVRGERGGNRVE